jgi:TfoX/Sxy family transcriptional regulator of competence genes
VYFFALIAGDVLYLKVGDANRSYYEERGMRRFQPYPGKQHLSMNYYELPAEVLEDSQQCGEWARRSLAMAGADKPRRSRSSAARPKLKAP